MQTIRRTTVINAPVDRCFLLSLRVDIHVDHPSGRRGEPLYGVSLAGQTVTWSGKHLGLPFEHTSLVDRYRPYSYFRDVTTSKRLALFEHEHHFASLDGGTRIRDEIRFAAPPGPLSRFAESRLQRNLLDFIKARNLRVRQVAESDQWRRYLDLDLPAEPAPKVVEPPIFAGIKD